MIILYSLGNKKLRNSYNNFFLFTAKLPPKCTRSATEFFGTVIDFFQPMASYKSCRKFCESMSSCNYWTYISKKDSDTDEQKMCKLMSDKSGEIRTAGTRKSGSRTC